jgi:serine O-acetyltransferase
MIAVSTLPDFLPAVRPGFWRQICEDVACVKARDPAARYALEIVLTYPGVHALLGYRIANLLWRHRLRFLARMLSWFTRLMSNVDIHPAATIGRRFFIDHGAGVVIGETAEIGDDVTIYHGVTLGGTSWSPGKRHPTVQDGALIGAAATILGPITIGRGVRVGANTVVMQDVPPEMTVVGMPGKIVRTLRRRHAIDGRIDLEHHLMPDPVSDALAALIDRIEFLEARLTETQHSLGVRVRTATSSGGGQNEQPNEQRTA